MAASLAFNLAVYPNVNQQTDVNDGNNDGEHENNNANLPDRQQNTQSKQQESLLANLVFNIVIPTLILSKLANDDYLGTTWGLIIALLFPLGYGLRDFLSRGKINVFSVLGLVSTLLTGTISLLALPPSYIAIKEAAIPGIIFLLVLISTWTPFPLVEKLILNESIFDLKKLGSAIEAASAETKLHKATQYSSYMVASSFLLSTVLNYTLASIIVVSQPGTAAYNEELGKLMAWSYPAIALPCTVVMGIALFYLIHRIQKLTGESIEEFMLIGK